MVYITEISQSENQWTLYVPPDYRSTLLRFVHLIYLSVLCESEKKEKLFRYTTLTDGFI